MTDANFESPKSAPIDYKSAPRGSRGLIKAFWREAMRLSKKNIHI